MIRGQPALGTHSLTIHWYRVIARALQLQPITALIVQHLHDVHLHNVGSFRPLTTLKGLPNLYTVLNMAVGYMDQNWLILGFWSPYFFFHTPLRFPLLKTSIYKPSSNFSKMKSNFTSISCLVILKKISNLHFYFHGYQAEWRSQNNPRTKITVRPA